MGNTRPIALLETFRKCITKILSNRLSKVLVKYQILRGWNFAGLPGGSTEHPAHIVNMIAEDAKEKEAELWIVLQDMKKAFDSVSLKMLKKTLERIKIPAKLIDLVLLLFENRRSQIITAVGLTDPIELKDGIEQGEVLSPLLWRIFYDPLLTRVQEDKELGYCIGALNPDSIQEETERKEEVRVSVVAYADDTTWIAASRQAMEKTLAIANEFFELNDIQINSKKSNLLIFNPKSRLEKRSIFFGNEEIIEEKPYSITRMLGVWLNCRMNERLVFSKARGIIQQMVETIRYKKLISS